MNQTNGYIYVRNHPSYDVDDVCKMGIVERLLQNEFRELNVKYDAGTEFYNKKIITLIEPYLITLGIKYRKLTKQEISDLVRCNRVRKTIKKINIQSLIHILNPREQITKLFPTYQETTNLLLLESQLYIFNNTIKV